MLLPTCPYFLELSRTFSKLLQLPRTLSNLLRTDPGGPWEFREGPQGPPGNSTKRYVEVIVFVSGI